MMGNFFYTIAGMFGARRSSGGYDMTTDNGRRKSPRTRKVAEEAVLTQRDRDIGTATIYDMLRNDPVVFWSFSKFLDYVTKQYFAARTGDNVFNDELENAVEDWMRPRNCDISGRNHFDTIMRIFGGAIALDGDAALLKLENGFLQGIESDRIRSTGQTIGNHPIPASTNGVVINPETGRAKSYLVFNRGETGDQYFFEREIPAENMIFQGNFMRFDQVRGIPLISSAVNTFIDAKETDEYQRIKAKNHALLAVAVTSQAGSGLTSLNWNQQAPLNAGGGVAGGDGATGGDDNPAAAYGVYDTEAAMKLELEQGDSVNLLESHTPSTEYQAFNDSLLRRGMLSLGLPFTFYNSEKSSYSSMKQDRAEFKFSIQRHLTQIIEVRTEITEWIMPMLIKEYGLNWSKANSPKFEWIPQADPWLEEDKEVSSALERIAGGLSSPQRECRRRGVDAFDVLRENESFQKAVRESGVVYAIGVPGGNLFNAEKVNKEAAKEENNNNAEE